MTFSFYHNGNQMSMLKNMYFSILFLPFTLFVFHCNAAATFVQSNIRGYTKSRKIFGAHKSASPYALEFRKAKHQLSSRCDCFEPFSVICKKALASCKCFLYELSQQLCTFVYMNNPVNITRWFKISTTLNETNLFPFVSSFNSAFSDTDFTKLLICSI